MFSHIWLPLSWVRAWAGCGWRTHGRVWKCMVLRHVQGMGRAYATNALPMPCPCPAHALPVPCPYLAHALPMPCPCAAMACPSPVLRITEAAIVQRSFWWINSNAA